MYEAAEDRGYLQVSENAKTGLSVNLPIVGSCQPTKACSTYCYAGSGMLQFKAAMALQMRNLKLAERLEHASQAVVDRVAMILAGDVRKTGKNWLRWNGSGDLVPGTVRIINAMARLCPDIAQWVTSRKPDMIERLDDHPSIKIMPSLDGTEGAARRDKILAMRKKFKKAAYRIAYVRLRDKGLAPKEAFVVFNEHSGPRRYGDDKDKRACPATVPGGPAHDGVCDKCRRCFA